MTEAWPAWSEERCFPEDESMISAYQELVRGIRNIRMEMNVPAKTKTDLVIACKDEGAERDFRKLLASMGDAGRMVSAKKIEIAGGRTEAEEGSVSVVMSRATAYIPLSELVDREKEIARLTDELGKMVKEIARAEGMLANPKFVSQAPAAKVEEERAKLARYVAMRQQIEEQLEMFK